MLIVLLTAIVATSPKAEPASKEAAKPAETKREAAAKEPERSKEAPAEKAAPSKAEAKPAEVAEAKKSEPAAEAARVEKPEEKSAETPKTVVPPSLSKSALCGELAKTGKDLAVARKKIEDDRKAVDAERLRLEKLAAEIADARVQMRAETERLQALIDRRDEMPAGPTPAPTADTPKPRSPPAPKGDFEGLAKTMKSMKPDAAAALLQRAEPALAAAVLKRMKPAEAGAVIDRLKPDHAAELFALMATMPAPAPSKGGK